MREMRREEMKPPAWFEREMDEIEDMMSRFAECVNSELSGRVRRLKGHARSIDRFIDRHSPEPEIREAMVMFE